MRVDFSPVILVNAMQADSLTPGVAGSETGAQHYHKNILRLALCFRAENKRIDALLNRLSKLKNEDKAKHVSRIVDDVLDAIIAHCESRSTVDPLSKFARKLDALGLHFESGARILDGESTAARAETLAGEIAKQMQAIDTGISPIETFCAELPVNEELKREIRALQETINRGHDKLAQLDSFKHLIAQLHEQLLLVHESEIHGDLQTSDDSKNTLLELINLIEFPKSVLAAVDKLRQQLSDNKPDLDLLPILGELARLIEQSRLNLEDEIERLARFLSNLFTRLEKLDALLAEAASEQNESAVNQDKLQNDFQHQVSSMRNDLGDENDIGKIRSLVSTRIDKLSSTIASYLTQESERQQRASARVDEMSQTVSALESKTAQLNEDLEQQKLQSQTDPLTKILNRAGYQGVLEEAIEQFQKNASVFSLGVFDIDHFKKINDTFGHLAGDKVLMNLAQQVKSEIRSTDRLCRYGGEEFVIVMPNTDGPSAHLVMEALRQSVEQYHFHHHDTTVPVTISCGTAEYRTEDGAGGIFERADQALYRAKAAGRNRALLAS